MLFALVSLPLAISAIVFFINHRYDGVALWNIRYGDALDSMFGIVLSRNEACFRWSEIPPLAGRFLTSMFTHLLQRIATGA